MWACRPGRWQRVVEDLRRGRLLHHQLAAPASPSYRQEQINARSGVHTPRSTLAGWGGQTGALLLPLYAAHRLFVLGSQVVHADETPIGMLTWRGQNQEGLHAGLRQGRLRG